MRYILYLFIAIFLIIASIYTILFTPLGNKTLQPIAEKQINASLPFEISLESFRLSLREFEVTIRLSEENRLKLEGRYDIFTQSIDGKYVLEFLNLSKLQKLVDYNLSGALQTKGEIRGDLEFLRLRGLVALADGVGDYSIDIKNLQLHSIVANLNEMDLSQLLKMVNLPQYANGKVFLQTDVELLATPKGNLKLFVKDGVLNENSLKDEFEINLHPSQFIANMQLNIDQSTNIDAVIDSELAKIKLDAKMVNQKVDATYSVAILHLEALEPLLGKRLSGAVELRGSATGHKDNIVSKLVSDFAAGVSEYTAVLKNNKPHKVVGKSEGIEFQKVFYALGVPQYVQGKFDLELTLDDLQNHPNGKVTTKGQGAINNTYLQESFDRLLWHNSFSFQTDTNLQDSVATTQILVDFDKARLDIQDLIFALNKNQIVGKYVLNISDLSQLKGLIEKELRGEFLLSGGLFYQVEGEESVLEIDGVSHSLGGELEVKLKNKDLMLQGDDILIEKLLHILKTPIIFAGNMDMILNYDIEASFGTLSADLARSQFTKSFFTDAIKEYTGIELTNKEFQKADVNAKISGKNIVSDFVFQVDDIVLSSEKLYINTTTNHIKGNVTFISKNQRYNIKLNGSLDNLQGAFDYEDLLRQEVQRQIEKKAKEFIKKELGDDLFQKFRGLF